MSRPDPPVVLYRYLLGRPGKQARVHLATLRGNFFIFEPLIGRIAHYSVNRVDKLLPWDVDDDLPGLKRRLVA